MIKRLSRLLVLQPVVILLTISYASCQPEAKTDINSVIITYKDNMWKYFFNNDTLHSFKHQKTSSELEVVKDLKVKIMPLGFTPKHMKRVRAEDSIAKERQKTIENFKSMDIDSQRKQNLLNKLKTDSFVVYNFDREYVQQVKRPPNFKIIDINKANNMVQIKLSKEQQKFSSLSFTIYKGRVRLKSRFYDIESDTLELPLQFKKDDYAKPPWIIVLYTPGGTILDQNAFLISSEGKLKTNQYTKHQK
jgi:hypothetical protein